MSNVCNIAVLMKKKTRAVGRVSVSKTRKKEMLNGMFELKY